MKGLMVSTRLIREEFVDISVASRLAHDIYFILNVINVLIPVLSQNAEDGHISLNLVAI